jgi:hypothetical protein
MPPALPAEPVVFPLEVDRIRDEMRGRLKVLFLVAVLAGIVSVLAPSDAATQEKKGGVIRLEETIIEGRVAKPNAFFINTRQALVYDSMEIKESFVSEIVDAVKQGPF